MTIADDLRRLARDEDAQADLPALDLIEAAHKAADRIEELETALRNIEASTTDKWAEIIASVALNKETG